MRFWFCVESWWHRRAASVGRQRSLAFFPGKSPSFDISHWLGSSLATVWSRALWGPRVFGAHVAQRGRGQWWMEMHVPPPPPSLRWLSSARRAVCACALFVTHPNTMNKVSAIVLKKATAVAAAVASRSHVTSSSLKNKNGYATRLLVLMDKFEGSVTMDEADYSFLYSGSAFWYLKYGRENYAL